MESKLQRAIIGIIWVSFMGYGAYHSYQQNQPLIGTIVLIGLILGAMSLILIKEAPIIVMDKGKKIPIYH